MNEGHVGILHPGEMGTALAKVLRDNGFNPCWTASGRSAATRERARMAGLKEMGSLAELCAECPVIFSVCPPHAARDVARQVAAQGFGGIFVDANAVSPAHAREIQGIVAQAGASFVDAAIVGPPPAPHSRTVIYLCGPDSAALSGLFAGNAIHAVFLDAGIGSASAIKMCHSAVHKGLVALLFSSLATAEKMGVRDEVENLWASRESTAGYVRGMDENLRRAPKAWRFAGEMDEIALTLGEAGQPEGFHRAASEIFRRLAGLKTATGAPDMEQLLNTLLDDERNSK